MLSLLGIGAISIAFLLGFCIYKMQGFKHNLQESLNSNLKQITQQNQDFILNSLPFECSGIFFIECKSPYITFKSQILNQDVLTSRNLILSLKEIDFGSVTLNAKSDLEIVNLGDLQDYALALFPQSFDLDLTIKPQSPTSYILLTSLNLIAQNAEYTENFSSLIDSIKVKELGLFEHISSFAFLDEGLQIKDLELSLLSKGLSEKLFEIAQNKYGKSLNKEAYFALATFLASVSIEGYANKPYYSEVKDLISAFLSIALGNAQKMQALISPKNNTPLQSNPLDGENLNDVLSKFFANYNLEIKLTQ